MPQIKQQIEALGKKAGIFCQDNGEKIVRDINENSALTIKWLSFLNDSCRTGMADELLDGLNSSIMEAACCAALGLVRPALFAMRTEIDLALSWLYFKDHRVEWLTVNKTGDGYKLKREIFEYLDKNFSGFASRIGILKQICKRSEVDTYRLLSAHIHAQSTLTMPKAKSLQDVVKSIDLAKQCSIMAAEVDEYVNDVFICAFADKWAALPEELVKTVESRFKSTDQKLKFYEGI